MAEDLLISAWWIQHCRRMLKAMITVSTPAWRLHYCCITFVKNYYFIVSCLSLPPRDIIHSQEADIDRLVPLEAWLLLLGVLDVYGLASWLWRGGANIGGRLKKGGKKAGGLRPCASAALHHSEKRESKLPYNIRVDNLNETGPK